MTPPKSILRKCTDMRKPIQRVRFTKSIARHTEIRDQNPSLGYICPGEPHQRSPNAPKFEDRSQDETEWQEQGAREAAWKLTKSVLKPKEQERATFFPSSENRCLPALKPEEREFVVDSGASMHMISKKDLGNAEMDTLTKSCSPTIIITANGEVQTHEEATVYVKELDIFLTMKVLENTRAVLSLGKFCNENGGSHASSSHEVSLEPTTKRREDLGKHSVYTHFPKDRNCEFCKKDKNTRAPCRRRNGGAVSRAEKFGDLITADHKVLSDNCESRNNHLFAVVVQDLAIQWIHAYPCKTKTSQETQRSLHKFLEPERNPSHLH